MTVKRLVLTFALCSIACQRIDFTPVYAPVEYGDDCLPLDAELLGELTDPATAVPFDEIPDDCEAASEAVLARFEADGYAIETKGRGMPFPGFTTVLPGRVLLGRDFDDKSCVDKAITWTHEDSHRRQIRKYGADKFYARWVFDANWRAALELSADRGRIRARARFGVSTDDEDMSQRVHSFFTNYSLAGGGPSLECLHEMAAHAWVPELVHYAEAP